MKQKLQRICTLLLFAALCAGTSVAQNVAISSVLFPKAQASTSQPVRFVVHNYSFKEALSTTAKVGIKDGEKVLCEKEVQLEIPKMGNQEVELPIRLQTDYGKSYNYSLYINVEGNTNTNTTTAVKFTMPQSTSWPITWGSELVDSVVTGYGSYKYFSDPDMFVAQGRVSVVNNGGVLTLPITFSKGDAITAHFSHYSDLASTVYGIVDYGERIDTVFAESSKASTKLTDHYFSFTAEGPAIVRLAAKATGSYNTYGQMQLGRLSVYEAKPDLSLDAILAPAATAVCMSDDGYEVKVRVSNTSPFDITSPTLAYTFGGQEVSEVYEGVIKASETVEYTFKTRLIAKTATSGELKVMVTAAGDENTANNSRTAQLKVYAAQAFPYTTTFDSGNDLWTIYDGNADGIVWGFASDATLGNLAYFPSDALASDDWLFSPAIKMPKGKSRISFYYSGGRLLTQHLRVLMGTEPSPDKMTEVLFDEDVKNNGWLNGYHLINLPEEGVRYFAFQTTGKSDQIIIDNIKIDLGEDLCIGSVDFDEKSGFAKTSSQVKLSFANHGLTAQKDIKVRYWLNTESDPYTPSKAPYAEETVAQEVQPGDTIAYTFSKLADISTTGETYALVGQIATEVGTDAQNDIIAGTATVENWAMSAVPYAQGFEDAATVNKQWTFVNEGTSKWLVGNNSAGAYQGTKSLCHTGKVAEGKEDWAFSEPFSLKKGSYDLSFFYRTSKNFKKDTYSQTFRAMLATAPQADKVGKELLSVKDLLVAGQWAKKLTTVINIEADGVYYLAFGNTTANSLGMTFIDNISLTERSAGQALPYTLSLDDEDAEQGIEKYYPSSALPQWKLTVQADGTKAEMVERTQVFSDMSYGSEGYLVLPKLQVESGKSMTLKFDYALTCDLTPGLTLNVYDGTENNPENFTLRQSLPVVADSAFAQASIALPAQANATQYYIAMRTSAPEEGSDMKGGYVYTAKVKNFAIDYDVPSGVTEVGEASPIVVSGNTVTAQASEISVYDLLGRKVAHAYGDGTTATVTLPKGGVYVVKAGTTAIKVVTR